MTLSILTNTLFDFELGENQQIVTDAAEELQSFADMEGTAAIDLLLPSCVPTPGQRRYDRAMGAFDDTVDTLISERQADPGQYDDFLTMMLEREDDNEHSMSESEIHDHLITFLIAGHETTATALSFACSLLATHTEERQRVQKESERVVDGTPTPSNLDQLVATEQVAKESMRLYPPAALLFREAIENTRLGGYDVPAGTKVLLPQFTVHKDERWFENPEKFRPERFSEERVADRPDFAYFPFGGGPHQCIGMHFAMMELKYVIPILMKSVNFELLSSPEPDLNLELTLQPAHDIRMKVNRIDR